jgi:hypothetical protein
VTKAEKSERKRLIGEAMELREIEDGLDRVEKKKEYPLDIFKQRSSRTSQPKGRLRHRNA